MQTINTYKLEDVLPLIDSEPQEKNYKKEYINFSGYDVNVNSYRLRVFKNSLVCVCCGIVGCKFLLRADVMKGGKFGGIHLDMFAEENGEDILMTMDHIIPLAQGGPNKISNLQTMCTTCNSLKGMSDISLNELAELKAAFVSINLAMREFNAKADKNNIQFKFKQASRTKT